MGKGSNISFIYSDIAIVSSSSSFLFINCIVINNLTFVSVCNNPLDKYKENLKKTPLREQVKKEIKIAEKNVVQKIVISKDEEEIERAIRWTSDAIFLMDLNKRSMKIYNINYLIKKKMKISEEILCKEIEEIRIDIGTVYKNRGAAIFPKWDYGSEEKKDEVFGKNLFTLEFEVQNNNEKVRKFAAEGLRDKIKILIEWAKENKIKIVDENNIIKQLEEKDDAELYRYYKNEKGEQNLAMKNHNKIYGD